MRVLLQIVGGVLIVLAGLAAVALPGADANATLDDSVWTWIISVAAVGGICLLSSTYFGRN